MSDTDHRTACPPQTIRKMKLQFHLQGPLLCAEFEVFPFLPPSESCILRQKLVDVTADAIEDYLRRRLRQRVRVKLAQGSREKGILKSSKVHQEFRVLRRMLNVAVRKKL